MNEGATASVYRGWDRHAARPAAIKVLKRSAMGDPCSVARFESEARLLGRLRHPNLLPVIGAGRTDQGLPWFATAWADRGSLADQMVKHGPIPAHEAIRRALQVLLCLEYLHGLGIVHRDVRPENILVGDDDVAVLSDLGSARSPDRPCEAERVRRAAGGEPAPVGGAEDLFGLGVTLFEVLTGQSGVALRVPGLRDAALATLPAGLRPIVDRATRTCPGERYRTARDMARDLHKLAVGRARREER